MTANRTANALTESAELRTAREAALTAAAKPAKTAKPALVELTPATVDITKAILTLKAGKLGTLLLLETAPGKSIYSIAQLGADGKVAKVWPAHANRVPSPRHLPRAIRELGSWVGENGGDEFANGPKSKAE